MAISEPVLVFGIQTVPDLDGGRRVLGLQGMNDGEVAAAMRTLRRARQGSELQPAHLQRVIAIAAVLREGENLRCWSLGDMHGGEAELLGAFFAEIDRHRPALVSWNGAAAVWPVLQSRALLHGLTTAAGVPEPDQGGHTGLAAALAAGAEPPALREIAMLLGLPATPAMDHARVFEPWRAGRLAEVHADSEAEVMNTWLVYLRWQLLRGRLTREQHAAELARVREFLAAAAAPHWKKFLTAWS